MEFEEKEEQKLDLFVLIDDFVKEARRKLALAMVLVIICAGAMAVRSFISYSPRYVASASFTVRISNPTYASVSSYNTKTAEQMAATFPSILTSGVLQQRVKEHLGISYMPSVNVSANGTTSIITVKVTDSDPQRAYDVLNAVMEYYPEVAEFVVGSTELVLLDESGIPNAPSNPRDLKSAAVRGALIGAGLWFALVALLALTRSTIHNEKELKNLLNTPCVGQVPHVKVTRKNPCPLVHKSKKQPGFAEGVRLLRIHMEKTMADQNQKVLLVSSAIPGEGKTTVSVNLGISMARKGRKVLLIDCDLRNPSVAKALQMETPHTLADYLQGKVTVRDMIASTEVENLHIISGAGGKTMTEKLGQERFARLVQAARNLYDYVILDTPPCSLLADAAEVAELADTGLLVIRHDFASREQILDGIQRLSDGGLRISGCVLNSVHRTLSGTYGQGYGYGYGYGYSNSYSYSYGYGYGDRKK